MCTHVQKLNYRIQHSSVNEQSLNINPAKSHYHIHYTTMCSASIQVCSMPCIHSHVQCGSNIFNGVYTVVWNVYYVWASVTSLASWMVPKRHRGTKKGRDGLGQVAISSHLSM